MRKADPDDDDTVDPPAQPRDTLRAKEQETGGTNDPQQQHQEQDAYTKELLQLSRQNDASRAVRQSGTVAMKPRVYRIVAPTATGTVLVEQPTGGTVSTANTMASQSTRSTTTNSSNSHGTRVSSASSQTPSSSSPRGQHHSDEKQRYKSGGQHAASVREQPGNASLTPPLENYTGNHNAADDTTNAPAVGAFRVQGGRHAESIISEEDDDDDPTTILPPEEQENSHPQYLTTADGEPFLAQAVLVEEEEGNNTAPGRNLEAQTRVGSAAAADEEGRTNNNTNDPVLVHAQVMNTSRKNYYLMGGFLLVVALLAVVLLLVVVGGNTGGGGNDSTSNIDNQDKGGLTIAPTNSQILVDEPTSAPNNISTDSTPSPLSEPSPAPSQPGSTATVTLSPVTGVPVATPSQPGSTTTTVSPVTGAPTAAPTTNGISETGLPTTSPLQLVHPSPAPVVAPTTTRTVPPTQRPTLRPTMSPTQRPTFQPTVRIITTPLPTAGTGLLADGQSCKSSEDCFNQRCARSEESQFADYICCTGGDALFQDVSWSYSDDWVCSHLPVGAKCGADRSCESGVCLEGSCAESFVADGDPCDSSSDCASLICGLEEESQFAASMCCAGGKYEVIDVSWSFSDWIICRGLPDGAKCSLDRQCESKRCLAGECIASAMADGESCDSSGDCASRLCALQEASQGAAKVCCKDGDGIYQDVSWSYSDAWVCSHLKAGEKCILDSSCESGICLFGVCSNSTVADGGGCDSNRDCASWRCARSEYSSLAPKQCCQDGDALYIDVSWTYVDEWICSHLAVGDSCNIDRSYESGRCALGKCIAEPIADGGECDSDHDCASNRCTKQELLETAPNVCCPNGLAKLVDVSWSYLDEYICDSTGSKLVSGVGDGDACSLSTDCSSGSCAQSEFDEFATNMCCSGGERYVLSVPWSYSSGVFCGNLQIGTSCGDDRMCSSGLCIDGSCAISALTDGERCTSNTNCISRVCAKKSFTEQAGTVCCKGGEAYLLGVSYSYSSFYFCGNLDVGTPCGDDRLCSSGLCINGECATTELDDVETCTEDSDCLSGNCAYSSFAENADQMCCPGGESYILGVPWTYSTLEFCAGLSLGTVCGDDRLCASGMCVNGECASSRLPDTSLCRKNSDCSSLTCARKISTEASSFVCCTDGEAFFLNAPWTYSNAWFCGNSAVGSTCGDDRQCGDGLFCVQGECSSA